MQRNKILLGIAGQARSGKDTIAEHLIRTYGFQRYAFADPIKETVNDMFGWDDRHRDGSLKEVEDPYWGFSPRQAYQLFGTEFGRALNPNIWIMMAQMHMNHSPAHYVISDVRFENEANFVRRNGILLHVQRKGAQKVNDHVSETPVNIIDTDYVVTNDGTINQLYQMVDSVLNDYINKELSI